MFVSYLSLCVGFGMFIVLGYAFFLDKKAEKMANKNLSLKK